MSSSPLSDRLPIAFLPTPLHRLDRFSAALAQEFGTTAKVWVKRDDQTGLASGGNKARKLEYLMHAAVQAGATVVLTAGAMQSNHARQTAAAAAQVGMLCVLVLSQGALDDAYYTRSGNVLLDQLLGADIRQYPAGTDLAHAMETEAAALRADGEVPYIIPVGGSSATGALGYVGCAEEIRASGHHFDAVVLGTGSGGTQAGLLNGFAAGGAAAPYVLGVSIASPADEQAEKVHSLTLGVAELIGSDYAVPADAVHVVDRYVGAAYGVPTDSMRTAVELVATTEGLLLDPVYTGKAMAGLIGELRPGGLLSEAEDILFVHTGGQIGLTAYQEHLSPSRAFVSLTAGRQL